MTSSIGILWLSSSVLKELTEKSVCLYIYIYIYSFLDKYIYRFSIFGINILDIDRLYLIEK